MKWNHHLRGKDISTQLEKQVNVEQAKNKNCLKKIITSLQYLARQGLSFHGHIEENGKFYQLIKLCSDDCDDLRLCLQQKRAFMSNEVQNEILQIISHQILRSIIKDTSSAMWYSIMADKTVDASLIEQVCHNVE